MRQQPPADNPSNVPIPDPSTLTTDAIRLGYDQLRDLFEARLEAVHAELGEFKADHEERHTSVVNAAIQHRKELSDASIAVVQTQIDAQFASLQDQIEALKWELATKATTAALDAVKEATQTALVGLDRVTDAKFVTFRTLVDSQAEKVALALAGSDRAVDNAFTSSKLAIDAAFASSATAIAKAETFNEKRFDLISKQIDELKTSVVTRDGTGAGQRAAWGYLVAAVGLAATIIAIILAFNN